MVGIYIDRLKNVLGYTSAKGSNHFGEIGRDDLGNAVYFSSKYNSYDWIDDNGYDNLGSWIEQAAVDAGK